MARMECTTRTIQCPTLIAKYFTFSFVAIYCIIVIAGLVVLLILLVAIWYKRSRTESCSFKTKVASYFSAHVLCVCLCLCLSVSGSVNTHIHIFRLTNSVMSVYFGNLKGEALGLEKCYFNNAKCLPWNSLKSYFSINLILILSKHATFLESAGTPLLFS